MKQLSIFDVLEESIPAAAPEQKSLTLVEQVRDLVEQPAASSDDEEETFRYFRSFTPERRKKYKAHYEELLARERDELPLRKDSRGSTIKPIKMPWMLPIWERAMGRLIQVMAENRELLSNEVERDGDTPNLEVKFSSLRIGKTFACYLSAPQYRYTKISEEHFINHNPVSNDFPRKQSIKNRRHDIVWIKGGSR